MRNNNIIDLHTHTNCSDGDYSPQELIILAAKKGLTALAITDHDTVKAYDQNVISLANQCHIKLIPGVEFSTIDLITHEKIHVVGLRINLDDNILKELCQKLALSRIDSVLAIAQKLDPLGLILRSQRLIGIGGTITKAHIAQDILANQANQPALLRRYSRIPPQGELIEDLLIKGCPAFVEKSFSMLTNEAVTCIKQAGGVAFCAHPSFNIMRGLDIEAMKALIIRNQFDGVEAINIQYDKSHDDKQFDMVDIFTQFAQSNHLLISGGSDFHSNNTQLWGRHSDLGLANERYRVTEEQLAKIMAN
jgi:predicted metal-dependent phosphoesterase TrpH